MRRKVVKKERQEKILNQKVIYLKKKMVILYQRKALCTIVHLKALENANDLHLEKDPTPGINNHKILLWIFIA